MPRRAPGSGQLFQSRSTGRWVIRARNPWTGTTVSRSRQAWGTQRDAQAALDALRAELTQPPPGPATEPLPVLTTGDYLGGWVEQKRHQVRPNTSQAYRYQRAMWQPLLGHIPLAALTPQHVQQAITALLTARDGDDPPYAPSTVARARTMLSTALNDAEGYSIISRNPVRYTRPPRQERREPPPLDFEEAERILASVQGTRLVAPVTLALCYGLRAGEICGLRWANVSEGAVRIDAQLARRTLELAPTKTAASTRVLPLLPLVAEALAASRETRANLAHTTPRWRETDFIVTRLDGGPLSHEGLYELWQRHQARAGLTPRRSFHALRHGAASLLAVLGVPERVAMEVVGHGSLSQHRRYQHIPSAVVTSAVERLGRALSHGGG
jgi:integrase